MKCDILTDFIHSLHCWNLDCSSELDMTTCFKGQQTLSHLFFSFVGIAQAIEIKWDGRGVGGKGILNVPLFRNFILPNSWVVACATSDLDMFSRHQKAFLPSALISS
jgi:hypothetical protein